MAVSKATKTEDIKSADEKPSDDKTVTFISPWGTRTTVGAEHSELFKAAGYKLAK